MNNQSLFMDQFKPNNGAVLVVAGLAKKPSEKGASSIPNTLLFTIKVKCIYGN